MTRPVVHTIKVRCRASRAAIWPLLADTRLLNQAVGSARLEVTPFEAEGSAARFETRTHLGGIAVRYTEEPFEWLEGRFFSWVRTMQGGPTRSIKGHYELTDAEGSGTIVSVRLTTEPRSILFTPVVWLIQGYTAWRLKRFIAAVDEAAMKREPLEIFEGRVDAERARRAGERLAKRHDRAIVDRLVRHVTSASDLDVQRMRPFELARKWEVRREDVLRLCLAAVGAGLLELRWAVLCPSCQVAAQQIPSLAELDAEAHCHFCDIRYGVELDRTVEATFTPHAAIRIIDPRPFCIGGPRLMPHTVAQVVARPPEPALLRSPEEPGRYRLFVRGGASSLVEVREGAGDRVAVEVGIEGQPVAPDALSVAPSGVLEINGGGSTFHAKIERTAWSLDAATALEVGALPEFRAQFGSDSLRPGLALKVARIAVLFSDLVGSTALYSEVGDAAAFGVVTDCLAFGRGCVERHGGVVVKTMGDAVMAAFTSAGEAMAAASDMLLDWDAFTESHAGARGLALKVGIAMGPCTIVTANGVLDYFGQTVNTAARMQHQAKAGQLVLAADLLGLGGPTSSPDAAPSSMRLSVVGIPYGLDLVERFEATLKGIRKSIPLVRLGIPGASRVVDEA